jgi:hypothetical protein
MFISGWRNDCIFGCFYRARAEALACDWDMYFFQQLTIWLRVSLLRTQGVSLCHRRKLELCDII